MSRSRNLSVNVDERARSDDPYLASTSNQSPKNSSHSPKNNNNDSGDGFSKRPEKSPNADRDREKDRAIMSLQQRLEATSVQREAVERNLRLEVDSLKTRLAISSEQFLDSSSGGSVPGGSGSADMQTKLMRELAEAKRTIAMLEQVSYSGSTATPELSQLKQDFYRRRSTA